MLHLRCLLVRQLEQHPEGPIREVDEAGCVVSALIPTGPIVLPALGSDDDVGLHVLGCRVVAGPGYKYRS